MIFRWTRHTAGPVVDQERVRTQHAPLFQTAYQGQNVLTYAAQNNKRVSVDTVRREPRQIGIRWLVGFERTTDG